MSEPTQEFSPKEVKQNRHPIKTSLSLVRGRVMSWRQLVQRRGGQSKDQQPSVLPPPDLVPGEQVPLPAVDFIAPQRIIDEHRTRSKPPVREFLYRNSKIDPVFSFSDMGEDSEPVEREFTVPSGERIIIDGIPEYDIESGERQADRTVQVYHNEEGFLMADKVIDGQVSRKGSVLVAPDEVGKMEILGKSYTTRKGDVMPLNYEKQLLPDGTLQLMATTYKFPVGTAGGHYSQVEVQVTTPDDAGDRVTVAFVGSHVGRFPEPITIKQIAEPHLYLLNF